MFPNFKILSLFNSFKISQGTVSITFGCHNIFHSIFVLLAWIKLYHRIPALWQLVCIFLHDIGHIGLDYLDDYEQKIKHWILGAKIGKKLFGQKAFDFLAGHCSHSGYPKSNLYKADKYSWYITPSIILFINLIFEPKLKMGFGHIEAIKFFKAQVKQSIESGIFESTHNFYLKRCKKIPKTKTNAPINEQTYTPAHCANIAGAFIQNLKRQGL